MIRKKKEKKSDRIKIAFINTVLSYIYTIKGICRRIEPVHLNGLCGKYQKFQIVYCEVRNP